MTAQDYILSFLLSDKRLDKYVQYGRNNEKSETKILIIPSNFFDKEVFGTKATLPKTPFALLPDSDIPFLFGEAKVERTETGRIILYADLVASAYYILSRYEEILKPECRDCFGRFLAKDSTVFQQGHGMRPLVDEWGGGICVIYYCKQGVVFQMKKQALRKSILPMM